MKQQLYANDPTRPGGDAPPLSRTEQTRQRATQAIDTAKDARANADLLTRDATAARAKALVAKGAGWLTGSRNADQIKQLDAAANTAGDRASAARATADRLEARAQTAAQNALTAQQKDNGVAAATGASQPHPAAAKVSTLAEAAQRPPEEQRAMFGTELPSRVATAAETQAANGAQQTAAQKRTAEIDASVARIDNAANQIQGTDKPYEGSDSEKSARRDATLSATKQLEQTLRDAPADQRGEILERSRSSIERMTRGMTILDGGQTKEAVQNLTNATEVAGKTNAHLITDPVAAQVAGGGLEEHGSFLGRHDHRSEGEFKDAVRDVMGETGKDTFARSLANQLVNHDDAGFAHAIATGGDVPGRNLTEQALGAIGGAKDAVGGALGEVKDFVGDIANAGGDYVRNKIAEVAQVDDRVRELNSDGDKFTMALGGELGAFGVQGGAKAQMEVAKNADGYSVSVSGEASAGVFAALGTNGTGAGVEANASGKVTVEAQFKTRAEAEQAAKTIAGIGIGTAVGGPVGAAVTAGSAGDEIKQFTDHISKTRIELGMDASASGRIGQMLGLSDEAGIGAGAGISAKATAAVEFKPGQQPELVFGQQLSGDASLNLGIKKFALPDGRHLSLAEARAEGSLSLETRVPLGGASVSDIVKDPIGALERVGHNGLDGATTKVTANVDVSGDIGLGTAGRTKTGRSDSAMFAGGGLNASISAEVPTKELGGALKSALSGDLSGAITKLGEQSKIDVNINSFNEHGFDLDERVNAGVFRIGVKVQHELRDETSLYKFSGSPGELFADGRDFFNSINPLSAH